MVYQLSRNEFNACKDLIHAFEELNHLKTRLAESKQINSNNSAMFDEVITDKNSKTIRDFLRNCDTSANTGIWCLPAETIQNIVNNLSQRDALNLMYTNSVFKQACEQRIYRRIVIYEDIKNVKVNMSVRRTRFQIPYPRYSKLYPVYTYFTFVKKSKFRPTSLDSFRFDLVQKVFVEKNSSKDSETSFISKNSYCELVDMDQDSTDVSHKLLEFLIDNVRETPEVEVEY